MCIRDSITNPAYVTVVHKGVSYITELIIIQHAIIISGEINALECFPDGSRIPARPINIMDKASQICEDVRLTPEKLYDVEPVAKSLLV